MAITKIKSSNITDGSVTDAKITALDSTKLTGTIATGRLSNVDLTTLSASNLTSGSIPNARVPASAVTQHVTGFDDSSIRADILKLALHQAIDGNRTAYNLNDSFVDGFEDDAGITTETTVDRNTTGEYVSSSQPATIAGTTKLLIDSNTTEGSTTFTDLSSVGRTITANSSISHTTAQKKFGASSLNYNGGTSWLYTDDAADLRFGTSVHTIECWFKQNSTENGPLVNKWIAGSYDAFYIHVTSNVLSVKATSSGSSWDINVNGSTNVADNEWHHMACTLNGTALTLWVDGSSDATGTLGNSGQIYDGTGKWTFGGQHQDGSNPFTGYIEDIHFSTDVKYTGTFTPAQSNGPVVAATGTLISDPQTASSSRTSCSGVILYEDAAGTNTLGTDLKIYFTANNGTNWTESSSYGTATTYSGTKKLVKLGATTCAAGTAVAMKAVWANQSAASSTEKTITAVGNAQHATDQYKIGSSSAKFDGTGDALRITSAFPAITGTGSFTAECWFRLNGSGTEYARILNYGSSTGGSELINVDFHRPGGNLRCHAATSGSSRDIFSQSTTSSGISDNTWHHLAYVRNGTSFKVYIDGSEKVSGTSSSSIGAGTGFAFGGYYNDGGSTTEFFHGHIDEMRVSSVARYTGAFTPSTSAFTTDTDTVLLIHSATSNGSTTFTDSSPIAGSGPKEARLHGWAVNY